MHIELAELLRCPEPHDEAFWVVSTDEMHDRIVTGGTIGCPVCLNEYPILSGVATFTKDGMSVAVPDGPTFPADAATVQALLNLSGPGGNVALIGSVSLLAHGLAELSDGVHVVACNAPPSVVPSPRVSVLNAPASIPLRTSSMRGIVVSEEMADDPWAKEAVRVLLRGTRLVLAGRSSTPEGTKHLVSGDKLVVGEKS